MTARLEIICAHLPHAEVFADIGCDHGYCTAYVLEKGLCERAYVSDISAACLKKAETLLAAEIAAGRGGPRGAAGLGGAQEAGRGALSGVGGGGGPRPPAQPQKKHEAPHPPHPPCPASATVDIARHPV